MEQYDYSHIAIKELVEELSHLPQETTVSVHFDDEVIRKAIQRKKAHEAIEKLEGSGSGKLYDRLMEERKKERERS